MGNEQVIETDDVFEIIWHIPLNANASKITKVERYMKDGSIVEGQRRDGRPGVLRSQLTFTQDGTPHIRFASLLSRTANIPLAWNPWITVLLVTF